MKEDYIILEGRNINKLIEEGLETLGKKENEVEIEILEKGISLVGLNIKKYKIKMKIKDLEKTEYKENQTNNSKTNLEDIESSHGVYEEFIDDDIGTFKISYLEDGVYLTAYSGNIIKVNLKEVMEKIERKEISEVDSESVKKIVKNTEGKPAKIAPSQEEKLIDSKVKLEISNDNMQAFITLTPPEGGKELLLEKVLETAQQKIKVGLDEDCIKTSLENKMYNEKLLIAKGIPAIDGVDGYIEYKFNTNKEKNPNILEDGSVDFRNLNLISNIKEGDVLAEKIEPLKGREGKNVLGDTIECRLGKEENFKFGKNIEISEDGTNLISQVNGQVCLENGKVVVHDVYAINTDVDNSTGNIDFNGSIYVKGNVLTGFKVTAKANIEIEGAVEGATIESEGNLVIKRGVQGHNVAQLSSKGDIASKYIENTKINCEGDVSSEAIMHSQVVSGGTVIVSGKKGLLVGGTCKASKKIVAKIIGSNMATSTILEVGLDPKLRADYDALKQAIYDAERDIDKFDKVTKHLTKLSKEGQLTDDRREMLGQGIRAKLQLEKKLSKLQQEVTKINGKIENSSTGEIKVEDVIYPGVRIIMGNSNMLIQEEMSRCNIYMDKKEGKIKVAPY